MKNVATLLLILCILLLPMLALAEDENKEDLKAIEITATRTSIEEDNPASALTVITQEEIQQKQHMQVKDILREQMGLNIVTPGRLGASSSLFMRGANSASTLVLIDGVQVRSNTTGAFDFQHLQMDNIERIEILRGPQSTLWGADAVGGVINIVTKRGKGDPTHSVSLEVGSFATAKETFSSSGGFKSLDYAFTASRTDSDGFSSFNKDRGATEKDGYANTTVSTRAGYNFWNDARAELVTRFTLAKNDFDNFNGDSFPNKSTSETFYIAAPFQKSITNWWDAKINLNFNYDKLDTINPSFSNSTITTRTYTADFQNNVTINKNISAIFGFEYQTTNGENTSYQVPIPNQFFDLQNESQGTYLQTNATLFDSLFLTAGIRYDRNSKFDNKFTHKYEAAYKIKTKPADIKIRGAYSTGFRAPSINQLIFPNFGNINIRPEESESWETGIEFSMLSGRLKFGSNYFHVDYTDLIESVIITLAPFVVQAQNVGSATSRGFENFINFKILDNLDVTANHTWNNAVNNSNDATLSRRPKNIFSVSLHHNLNNKLDSIVTVSYRGPLDSFGPRTTRVGGRTLVRAAVSYKVNENWKVTARGENLLDKDYEEPFRFGTQGMAAYAGFVYTFN